MISVHRKCYYSEFTCKNGQCIRPGFLCDRMNDCIDGSDEIECENGKYDFHKLCGVRKAKKIIVRQI